MQVVKVSAVDSLSGSLFVLCFLVWWIAGVVLAKGFWLTLTAIFMFPYALYLVVERVMLMHGWFLPVCG